MRSAKRLNNARNVFRKNQHTKGVFILDLKPFRLYVKGKQSIGREPQGLAV